MKNLILSTLFVALSFPVFAEKPEIDLTELKENCTAISMYAELAMLFRQTGKPIREPLAKVREIRKINAAYADVYEQYVVLAYTKIRFSTTENRRYAVNDFASDAYIDCLVVNNGLKGAK